MLADTIMNRITELREQKGVSEREMSIALGKSPNYLYFMKKRGRQTVCPLLFCPLYFAYDSSRWASSSNRGR